jgi:hypothetical protein
MTGEINRKDGKVQKKHQRQIEFCDFFLGCRICLTSINSPMELLWRENTHGNQIFDCLGEQVVDFSGFIQTIGGNH